MADSSKGKCILIVEDEKPIAKAMLLKLRSAGYEVEVAYNGEEGLDILDKKDCDLVLLDLVMPKMDGFGFLEEAKKKGNKVPVVVMSNLSQKEDLKKAKEMGAIDYFVKSDTPLSEIVKYIDKMFAKSGE